MRLRPPTSLSEFRDRLVAGLTGPQMLAFVPALCLGGYWFGGEAMLVGVALLLPMIWMMLGGLETFVKKRMARLPVSGLIEPEAYRKRVDAVREDVATTERHSAVFVLEIDDFPTLTSRFEPGAVDRVLKAIGQRLNAVSRDNDAISRIGDSRFAMCLAPVKHLDLESCIQMSGRIQQAIEDPIALDGTTVYVTASVGFCLQSRAPDTTGQDWINAAVAALNEAQKRGPTSVRAYSTELHSRLKNRAELRDEVVIALEKGQIQPWFQPQISTDTGKVTGFEALARWIHPTRGAISPVEFLPAIEEASLLERLAEVMMYHTFTALKAWDAAGVNVPQIGVNFSGSELSNPRLVEKISWELDRFDLTPDRLAVEILETVVTDALDDTITMNINALNELGCHIDLDDFGTGHASLSAIRRFGVGRIKIDRSFVMKADRDPEQQRMISAVLTMAERLGIETLAEGVETVGEHALLAQLGCDYVQGFGIARPMPFEKTLDWIRSHDAKVREAPVIPIRRSN